MENYDKNDNIIGNNDNTIDNNSDNITNNNDNAIDNSDNMGNVIENNVCDSTEGNEQVIAENAHTYARQNSFVDSQSNTFSNNVSLGAGSDKGGDCRTPSFYTENYKKTGGKKGIGLMQLILVALVSAVLGGAVVGGILVFVPSAIQPTVKSYFGSFIPEASTSNIQNSSSVLKKVEIEKSDSPVSAIAEKVSPSIVGIKVTSGRTQDFFGFDTQQGAAEGSGIIIKSDGYIMTNNHVISGALDSSAGGMNSGAKIEVILPNQIDKPYTAQVVGKDAKTDLAVLKINATGLPAAELGDSDKIKVGELAVAIGNPGGIEFMGSVTVGVISGLNRTISAEDNSELKLIQTDASINPGNSGGALVNSKGQVIGVNSSKIVAQGFEGLGFAIPINKVKEITNSLIEYKYVKGRPLLGVSIDQSFTEAQAKQYNVPFGLLISEVTPFSGASNAGVQRNDIITKFEGKKVKAFSELEKLKNEHKPGDAVELELYRYTDQKYIKVKIVLGENKN